MSIAQLAEMLHGTKYACCFDLYTVVSDDEHLVEHLHVEFDKRIHPLVMQHCVLNNNSMRLMFHGYTLSPFRYYVFPTSLIRGYAPCGTYRICMQWKFCDLALTYHLTCRYLVDIFPNLNDMKLCRMQLRVDTCDCPIWLAENESLRQDYMEIINRLFSFVSEVKESDEELLEYLNKFIDEQSVFIGLRYFSLLQLFASHLLAVNRKLSFFCNNNGRCFYRNSQRCNCRLVQDYCKRLQTYYE